MYITRRTLLQGIAAGLVSESLAGLFRPSFVMATPTSGLPNNLIVINLRGGVDALSAFPFHTQTAAGSAIAARRTQVAVGNGGLMADPQTGIMIHPALSAIHPLFQAQRMKIIYGFGNPPLEATPNLSHEYNQTFQAVGTPSFSPQSSGWLAKSIEVFGLDQRQVIGLGINGGIETNHGLVRMRPYVATRLEYLDLPESSSDWGGVAHSNELHETARRLREAHARAHPSSEKKQEVLRAFDQMESAVGFFKGIRDFHRDGLFSGYTDSNLGHSLEGIAKAIGSLDAESKPHIYYTSYDTEWDTHNDQVATLNGNLTDLGSNLARLVSDLQGLGNGVWERTLILTISEFGRRVFQNGIGGTDHGMGTAVFALGGRVQGGVIADPVVLNTNYSQAYYVPVTVHFQNLMSAGLSFLGLDGSQIYPTSFYTPVSLNLMSTSI